ncbi:MAG: nucleotide exchange factor GrpE [Alphaproteobacteria bacterium]
MSQNDNRAANEDAKRASDLEDAQNAPLEYDSFSEGLDAPQAQETEINEESARITILESELSRTKDQMIRAIAEAENTRKRAAKDRQDATKFAVSSFARDLLSVADNLRRALEAVPGELLTAHPQVKNLTDGIEATERELLRCFDKNGIEKTDPIDQIFDPNFHEVMFEAPMPDKPTGTIIQVLESGYILNGRILRPARVGISKDGPESQSPKTGEPGQNVNTEA